MLDNTAVPICLYLHVGIPVYLSGISILMSDLPLSGAPMLSVAYRVTAAPAVLVDEVMSDGTTICVGMAMMDTYELTDSVS